jgi:hypothetical protein
VDNPKKSTSERSANARADRQRKRETLNQRQQAFVSEYLIDLNATAAYKRAGYKSGSEAAAQAHACRLVGNGKVQRAIQDAMAARTKRAEIKADDVLRALILLAFASANELIEVRRTCCRYCHSEGFKYQRTPGEMAAAHAAWQAMKDQEAADAPVAPFDPEGGVGFDGRKDPHPKCPECFGEGVAAPFLKDTRKLSEGARRLFAGLKVTKYGIEVKMHDQDAALLALAKHLGMFAKKVEHPSTDREPLQIQIIDIRDHQEPAAGDEPTTSANGVPRDAAG